MIKQFEHIPDNSSSSSEEESPKQKSQNLKKSAFIGMVQEEVDDDDLMADFGISSKKKKNLNSFELKNTKTINWDVEENEQ